MIIAQVQDDGLITTREQWYWLVHKAQMGVFLGAWILYVPNKVNRFTRNVYIGFFVLNGLLYEAVSDHASWEVTSLIFGVCIILGILSNKIYGD